MLYFHNDKERQERIARLVKELWGKSAEPRPAKVQAVNATATTASANATDKGVLDHLRRP